MRHWRSLTGAAALAAVLALSACGGGSSTASKNSDGLTTLNVGVLPIVDVLPVYVGMEKGIFKKNGLQIKPTVAQGGSALTPSVLKGDLQIAFTNVISYMIAYQKKLPVQLVANGNYSKDPNGPANEKRTAGVLVTAPDSDITTPKQLNGKTISINALNGIQQLAVSNAIDADGGDSSTVKFLALPLQQAQSSLTSGKIDAASINEPFTSAALKAGDQVVARPFTDFKVASADYTVYMTSATFAQSNKDDVTAFAKAMTEASDYTQQHADDPDVRKILADYTKFTQDVANGVDLPYYTTKYNSSSLKELADLAVKYKILDDKIDVDDMLKNTAGGS